MKKDQNGFGLIEGLLVVIAVALVAFVGYYVWNNQTKKDTKTVSTTSSKLAATTSKQSTQTSQHYVTIKEWGVRAPYDGKLTLGYTIDTSQPSQYAEFSAKELSALDSDCVGRGGHIGRYAPTDSAADFGSEDMTVGEYFAAQATIDHSAITNVNGYWYVFFHDQAACGADIDKTQTLQGQTNDDVKALVPKLEAISN